MITNYDWFLVSAPHAFVTTERSTGKWWIWQSFSLLNQVINVWKSSESLQLIRICNGTAPVN